MVHDCYLHTDFMILIQCTKQCTQIKETIHILSTNTRNHHHIEQANTIKLLSVHPTTKHTKEKKKEEHMHIQYYTYQSNIKAIYKLNIVYTSKSPPSFEISNNTFASIKKLKRDCSMQNMKEKNYLITISLLIIIIIKYKHKHTCYI